MDWTIPNRLVDERTKEALMQNARRELRDEIYMRDKEHCRACGNEVIVDASPRERNSPAIAALDHSAPPTVENLVLIHRECLDRLREGGIELGAKLLKRNRAVARSAAVIPETDLADEEGRWIRVPEDVAERLEFHGLVQAHRNEHDGGLNHNYMPGRRITQMQTTNSPLNTGASAVDELNQKVREIRDLQQALRKADTVLPFFSAGMDDRLTEVEMTRYVEAATQAVIYSKFVQDTIWVVGQRRINEVADRYMKQASGKSNAAVERYYQIPDGFAGADGSKGSLSEGEEFLSSFRRARGQNDGDSAGNEQLLNSLRTLDLDPGRRALLQRIFNTWAEGGKVFVILDQDLVSAIKNVVGHNSSFSVGSASDDAGVGTSESTEKD